MITKLIHIHIDSKDFIHLLTNKIIEKNEYWILKELDSWGYTNSYNQREFRSHKGGWICKRNETIEIRICEMTFDYDILVKRFIHACKIIRRLRSDCFKQTKEETPEITYLDYNIEKVTSYIKSLDYKLDEKIGNLKNNIDETKKEQESFNLALNKIKNRVIKVN